MTELLIKFMYQVLIILMTQNENLSNSQMCNLRVLLTRYSEDNNVTKIRPFRIEIKGAGDGLVYAYLTDSDRAFTEIPLEMKGGVIEGVLDPDAFVLFDIPLL